MLLSKMPLLIGMFPFKEGSCTKNHHQDRFGHTMSSPLKYIEA